MEILAGIIAIAILFAAIRLFIIFIQLLVEVLIIEPIIDIAKFTISIINKKKYQNTN